MSLNLNNVKINGQKMRDLADYLKAAMPGCGFALIAFEAEAEEAKMGNYISNVQNDFMIATLEKQLHALKAGRTFATPEFATPSF